MVIEQLKCGWFELKFVSVKYILDFEDLVLKKNAKYLTNIFYIGYTLES